MTIPASPQAGEPPFRRLAKKFQTKWPSPEDENLEGLENQGEGMEGVEGMLDQGGTVVTVTEEEGGVPVKLIVRENDMIELWPNVQRVES